MASGSAVGGAFGLVGLARTPDGDAGVLVLAVTFGAVVGVCHYLSASWGARRAALQHLRWVLGGAVGGAVVALIGYDTVRSVANTFIGAAVGAFFTNALGFYEQRFGFGRDADSHRSYADTWAVFVATLLAVFVVLIAFASAA